MTEQAKVDRLEERLQQYRKTVGVSGAVGASASVAAVAMWQLVSAPVAEAVVTSFTGIGSSLFNAVNVQVVRGGTTGSFAFQNRDYSLLMQNIFQATGSVGGGAALLGPVVAQSASISTGMNYPNQTFMLGSSLPVNTLIALRLNAPGGNYFGWARLPDPLLGNGVYTFGFSDRVGVPVLAGTTTEVLAAVPEPTTALPLLLLGASGVALHRRRKQRVAQD